MATVCTNRVDQIRKVTMVEQWHHCPGTENPADVPSRGADPKSLSCNKLWLQGPEWLQSDITDQDSLVTKPEMPEECKAEQRGYKRTAILLSTTAQANSVNISELLSCENFSNSHRLIRVTAYVLRAAKLFKKRKSLSSSTFALLLSPQELAAAENCWITHAQSKLANQKTFLSLKDSLVSSLRRAYGGAVAGFKMLKFLMQPNTPSCYQETTRSLF